MGKPSIPTPPKPESSSQIAEATKETAAHMARLQNAMEFGDEMLKYSTAEDGSSVRYEVDKTEVPEGSAAKYEDQEVSAWGPTEVWTGHSVVKFDANGNTEKGINAWGQGIQIPKGTNYKDIASNPDWLGVGKPFGIRGDREYKSTVPALTGHTDPDGNFIPLGDYYRIDKDSAGNVTRTKVNRDEAVDHDFSGMGDIDRALKRWEFEKETSGEVADHMLSQARKYGLGEDGFIDTAVEMLKKSDETGYAAREMLGKLAQDYEPGDLPDLPELERMAGPELMERAGIAPLLPEVGLGDVPEYERAGAFGDLGRLGAEPTLEELSRGEAPGLERAGEMDALRRAEAAPEFGQIGAAGGIERAGEMAGLGRIGAAPTMRELGAGPGLERAGEMGDLERLAAFGGLERAEGIGDIQRAGEMAALERAEAAPTLERLAAEDIPEIPIDPESLAGRQFAERQFLDRAQSGRTAQLMGKRAQRLARGRAAGLGNIFGGGAVIEESTQIQEAEDAAQRAAMGDYMGFVQSGQTAGDYQARVAQQNLKNKLMGIEQRTGAETGEFGMGMQRLGADREASLQERADQLGAIGQRNQAEEQEYRAALQTLESNRQAGLQEYGLESQRRSFANEQQIRERSDQLSAIGQRTGAEQQEYQNLQGQLAQINTARQSQFGMEAQGLGINQQAQLQERADQLGAIGQRTGAQQQEYQNLLSQLEQQNTAMERGFQLDIQAAGFDNEAALRERTDQLSAIAQRTGAEQQEFANLGQIVSQMNQTRTGQFGMGGQRLEANTMQRMRERQDELSAKAQRNQAEEAEFQGLLSALGQQAGTRQAQYGLDMQGIQQRNVAAQQDLAGQQQAMAQRNQAAQQSFTSAMQKAGTEEQMKQQQMANLQSFSGLAPVSSQFGMLQGAGTGAGVQSQGVQYQPTNVMGLLQGQQNLAASNFGTQANIYGTQAQIASQPSGFGQVLGMGFGALTGGVGEGLGAGLAKKWGS